MSGGDQSMSGKNGFMLKELAAVPDSIKGLLDI